MNFSTGNTFHHKKFNYYSLFLLHAYIVDILNNNGAINDVVIITPGM